MIPPPAAPDGPMTSFSVAELASLHPDQWTKPFWDAARREVLVGCRCADCGTFRMPPGPLCPECSSDEFVWIPLSGRGTVFSYTIVRHGVIPHTRPQVPYVLALLTLDDAPGVRLVANVWDVRGDDVRIGMPVQVRWDHVEPDVCIPRFIPQSSSPNLLVT